MDSTSLCFIKKSKANKFRQLAKELHNGKTKGSIEVEFNRAIDNHMETMIKELNGMDDSN